MRILITNDDGIEALGIRMLVEWAKKFGEVTVVAPKVEQSGKSHGIELHKPIEVLDRRDLYGVEAYSVDSTPADCVRFGVLGMKRKYDLILSGINNGANLGKDIVYSGTVGAIFEAAAVNHKAIAFSALPDTLENAVEYLDMTYDFIVNNKLLDINPIYNINIPKAANGIKITRQGSSFFSDEFVPIGNNLFTQKGFYTPDADQNDLTLDAVAVNHGLISITPMQNDRTEKDTFKKLTILETSHSKV